MKIISLKLVNVSLLSIGGVAIALSLALIYTPIVSASSSWAQCGSDSYVNCSGGVTCSSTDDVGCSCKDANGRVVSRHSCRYASPEFELEISDF